MKEAAVEIFLSMVATALFAAGQIYTGGSLYLYWFLLSGTAAGAILVIVGGKRYSMFDTGANGIIGKFLAHFAVAVGLGPFALDAALGQFPAKPPEAVACAVGFALALMGTVVLLRVAPLLFGFIDALICKIPGMAQFQQRQNPPLPPPPATPLADPPTSPPSP